MVVRSSNNQPETQSVYPAQATALIADMSGRYIIILRGIPRPSG